MTGVRRVVSDFSYVFVQCKTCPGLCRESCTNYGADLIVYVEYGINVMSFYYFTYFTCSAFEVRKKCFTTVLSSVVCFY